MRRRVAIVFALAPPRVCVGRRGRRGRALQAVRPGLAAPVRPDRRPARPLRRTPGTVSLHVERLRARGRSARAPCSRSRAARARPRRRLPSTGRSSFRSALDNRDLVVFDQRGTGLSGVLRCPSLVRARSPAHPGAGAGRRALRRRRSARGAPSTRPGTRSTTSRPCAARSASSKITAVRRLVRDQGRARHTPPRIRSTSSGWCSTRSWSRRPRGLLAGEPRSGAARPAARSACGGCEQLTQDPRRRPRGAPVRDARGGLLYGPLVARGRPAPARPHRPAPAARPAVRRRLRPHAAGRAARRPAGAPARATPPRCCASRCAASAAAGPTPARYLSDALYTATVCEEGPLPWDAHHAGERAAGGGRGERARAAADGRWGPSTAPRCCSPPSRSSSAAAGRPRPPSRCSPTAPSPPCPPWCWPARTTCALRSRPRARVARGSRGRRWSAVPEMGHSVLSGFPRRCGLRAADDFFADRPVRPCAARRRSFPPLPPFPRSLAQVPRRAAGRRQARPHHHGRRPDARGRAGPAAERLVARGRSSRASCRSAACGRGTCAPARRRLDMHGLTYVPGVRLRGRITFSDRPHGVLRVTRTRRGARPAACFAATGP